MIQIGKKNLNWINPQQSKLCASLKEVGLNWWKVKRGIGCCDLLILSAIYSNLLLATSYFFEYKYSLGLFF